MKITYPSVYEDFYANYKGKLTWPSYIVKTGNYLLKLLVYNYKVIFYKDYDPRWREFYQYSITNTPSTIFFGPYIDAASKLTIGGTISKVVNYKGENITMMSIDLNLNSKDKFIDKVGLNEGYSYTFISSTNGLPLYYSNVNITKYDHPTFTKIEFCKQNTNCTDEPNTEEALKLKNIFFNLSNNEASNV